MRILVTGATGYIGGRLVPQLLDRGHDVRCLARRPAKLSDRPWRDQVEVVQGDMLDAASLESALDGVDAAYYLVHSMGGGGDFEDTDRQAAANFRDAADAAGIERLVYLGGLGDHDEELSPHLASRHEVGRTLRDGTTDVTELRAAVIIGSGSVSFEMLRYLTEVLPAMVTPSWVRTRSQPIAIRDVLQYLVAVLADPPGDHVYDIGGPEVVTYEDMMRAYADAAGLPRRLIVPVPVLSPSLSSRWIGLVTPLPVNIARPLVDSLRNEVVVRDDSIRERYPIELTPFRESIELALARSDTLEMPTRWSDASTSPARPFESDPEWSGGTLFIDRKEVVSSASTDDLFWAFSRIGGEVGYYGFGFLWRLRGLLDSVVGGVGLRRGRRHPEDLRYHETVDFWRVAAVERGRLLQLAAEMRLPGDAWLEFVAEDAPSGDDEIVAHPPHGARSRLVQTAYFLPRGLFGRLYWYVLLPFHGPIFGTMAKRIAEAAEDHAASRRSKPASG